MTRLAVLTVLAVLPAGGAAQRGDWPMPAKDYAATRYSDLTEITGANAGRLSPVWSFSTGVLGGHEGQPLVVDHTMYVVTPYPNVLYAFDLTREGYPLKWKYRPAVDPNALGIACCDAVNRGAFYADGKIVRSEEHTSELQSRLHLVCRLLLEKKKKRIMNAESI